MGVSQHATFSLEDVAAAAPQCARWFQLYILKDRALTADLLRRWVCDSRTDRQMTYDRCMHLCFETAGATTFNNNRSERAGYSAVCLTVDSVRFGSREADWRNNFNGLPPGVTLANYPTQVTPQYFQEERVCGGACYFDVPVRLAEHGARGTGRGRRGEGHNGQRLLLMEVNVNVAC